MWVLISKMLKFNKQVQPLVILMWVLISKMLKFNKQVQPCNSETDIALPGINKQESETLKHEINLNPKMLKAHPKKI